MLCVNGKVLKRVRSSALALLVGLGAGCIALPAQTTTPHATFDGAKALAYTHSFVTETGPRFNGSPGLAKAQSFLKSYFAKDQLQDDTFTSTTPAGPQLMHNFIVRFPGKRDGVIVLATHYETNYWLRDIPFVGANDGGATTGLLMQIASDLRAHPPQGMSVWLVFFDGEESVGSQWTDADSLYGSRHLAAKWQADGTLSKVKAFLLTDMIGDKSLDIQRDTNSTPWLVDTVQKAAGQTGNGAYFFKETNTVSDDHMPFVKRGVPCVDIIDIDYGPNDSYHHTAQDTLDKLSAHSLTISGTVIEQTIRLLDNGASSGSPAGTR
ncbi:M28 family peptidase [Acidipila sp. EB88]|uniref:M28 family peptidase n=1 Tax=Acidipila sp. EB88 TaxID=2305226 RepID=UPI000F5DA267|nr:M28 family peptidase [Acidipila sp. EB88]RRA48683.1 peptidase M28 [Acidipila sp. EB88]